MAEAVVEDRPQPPQRFYCHVCSVEVQSVNSDFTCPICSGGFIEELPAATDAPADDVEMSDGNGLNDLDMIRDEIATLFRSRTGSRPPDADGIPEEDSSAVGIVSPNGGAGGSVTVLGRTGGRRNRRRLRMQNFDRFDNILLEILQTLSGGNEAALGNASMFFMGNPGDYAWGREGIDTIVTQLLNQMDTTGPPPLPKEKIDEIPNVDITEEQVEHKLQCSVCWEDFKLNEPVRKLPCLHVYHENCIVPWLELHGTCPICRKSLTPDVPDVTNSLRNVTSFIRSVPEDQQQQYQSGSTLDNSFNGTTPSTNTTSSHQQDSQLIDHDIFNSSINIPLSLSRILSQPGTSQQLHHHPLSSSASAGFVFPHPPPAATTLLNQQQRQQPNNDMDVDCDRDGNHRTDGGGGGVGTSSGSNTTGTSSSGRSTRTTTQNDVLKYDDGNIEYDFD